MAIQTLDSKEIESVSGGGLLTSLARSLGVGPLGLFSGGGGTLGLGGLVRGIFGSIPLLGPLLVSLEALL